VLIIYTLLNLQPSSLSAKSSSERVTLRAANASHFRLVQNILLKYGTEFHTVSLSEECSIKVILKGIPNDISTDDLKEELETIGYTVKYVRRFDTPDKPMPICLVHIAVDTIAKDIFLLNNFSIYKSQLNHLNLPALSSAFLVNALAMVHATAIIPLDA